MKRQGALPLKLVQKIEFCIKRPFEPGYEIDFQKKTI